MWPSMVIHTRNLCSAFIPSKVHTHSSEHTHTRSSGQPFMLQRPGSSWEVQCLSQGSHLSHGIEGGRERCTFTPPTDNSCRTWDSKPRPLCYESDSLTIRPWVPLTDTKYKMSNTSLPHSTTNCTASFLSLCSAKRLIFSHLDLLFVKSTWAFGYISYAHWLKQQLIVLF